MNLRHLALPCLIPLLWLIACDRKQPVAPALEAGVSGVGGPTVKAPSNTNASAASDTRIDVSWQDNSTNETGFDVWRSSTGPAGTFTKVGGTGANQTKYSDVGLTNATQYCHRVRAFRNYDGKTSYSDFSSTACATTPAPPTPNAPSATDAVPWSSSTIEVTWTDNSAIEDGFRVERSLDGGTSWATVSTTAANVTSFQDAGRSSEHQVCYRVVTFNAGGDSPASNIDCTTPPAAPSGLTATLVDGGAIDLAWTDNSAVEDGYEVLKEGIGPGFGPVVADLPSNSTGYRDVAGGTIAGSATYVVLAKKDGGFSDFSNRVEVFASCAVEECGSGPNCPGGYFCGSDGCCTPHCNDGLVDGSESDVDCGGYCSPCAAGNRCEWGTDCASGSCVNNVCQP